MRDSGGAIIERPDEDAAPPRVTVKTVALYLIGNERAIRELARYKPLPWVGAVLVLTAGIAREYDHEYVLDYPGNLLFVLPLGVSLFLATILYSFYRAISLRTAAEGSWVRSVPHGYRIFVGLFWMTAPLAWLYAIPVERFLAPASAALANVLLLAIVAIWRVVLFAHATSIAFHVPKVRSLTTVLIPSTVLVGVISLFAPVFLVPVMGGLAIPPEASVAVQASWIAFCAAGIIGACALVGSLITNNGSPIAPLAPVRAGYPTRLLLTCFVIWLLALLPAQLELQRSTELRSLVTDGNARAALNYASRFRQGDFAATRRLPPDPYTSSSATQRELVRVFEAMDGTEAAWVRLAYLDHLRIRIGEHPNRYPLISVEETATYAEALARIPEGPSWIADRGDLFLRHVHRSSHGGEDEPVAYQRLAAAAQSLGINVDAHEDGDE